MASSSSPIEVAPALQRLIHDVQTFQIPALFASHSDLSQMENIERDLLATLKRIDVELDNFLLDCADAGNDAEERDAWNDVVQRSQAQVAQIKKESQMALIRARKERKAQARNALWNDMAQSSEEREKRREANLADQSSEDKLMTASGDVTSALQRAVTLMSVELEKSSYSSQLLDESSMAIQQATLQYTSFTDLVSSSKKLIKSMERADFLDAIMLSLSFAFFLLCIGYIVKVRIWDRGMGVLAFLLRLGGLGTSKSGQDVKTKLKMAKEMAKQVESSKAAQLAKTTIVSTLASITSTIPAGQSVPLPSPIEFDSDPSPSSTPLPSSTALMQEHFQHDEL